MTATELIIAPEPFTPRVERLRVLEGASIAEMLLAACEGGLLDPADLPCCVVFVDGEELEDRVAALDLVPRAGQMVNVSVLPRGGGGGGNKVLRSLLTISLMVIGNILLPGIGAAIGGMIGGLLGGVLFPDAKPAAGANAQQYNLEGQSNQQRLRQPMPLVAGRRRYAFDVASSAYTTTVGSDTFVTAMYGLHYGPCTVDDLKFGETLASVYPADELQVEYFLTPGPRVSALYPNRIDQQSLQTQLDNLHWTWATGTTGVDCERIELDFYWPAMYYTKSDGSGGDEDGHIEVQYSPYGANSWSPMPGYPAGTDKSHVAYPAGTLYVVANTHDPIRRTVGWTVPSGKYDVRVRREPRRGDRDVNDVAWTALRTIQTSAPAIVDQTLAVIILRAKASQDFSGTLGEVSGVVTPIAPQFDGTNWLGDPTAYDAVNWAPTSNAAALARYMLTGYPAARPLLASEIDSSCGDAYTLIATQGWDDAANLIAEEMSQADALARLGAAGRFGCYWNGQKLCFVSDWSKPVPKQLFNGRNVNSYRYKRTYPDPVHAVWVEFINADEDWRQDGLYVYADGYDEATAQLFETPPALPFSCSAARAYREGRVYLAKRKLLTETHEWTAGVDSLASTLGDRVLVRHSSTLFGVGEARVSFRRWAGALVSGVRLDEAITFAAGTSYAADVRSPGGDVIRGLVVSPASGAPGATRDLVFSTPLAASAAPGKGDLLVIGQVNVVTEDVELIDVSPQSGKEAQLRAQAYRADDIVAAMTGAVPALQTALTAMEPAQTPIILGSSGAADGVTVSYDVVPQRTAKVRGFTARYGRVLGAATVPDVWTTLPPLQSGDRAVRTPAITGAATVSDDPTLQVSVIVEIRTVLTTGETSPAAAITIPVKKAVAAPTTVTASGVARTAADSSSYPAIAVSADPVTTGDVQDLVIELKPHGAADSAYVAAPPLRAANPVGDVRAVSSGAAYDLRVAFRTQDNWLSSWVLLPNVITPGGSQVANTVVGQGSGATASTLAQLNASDDYRNRLAGQNLIFNPSWTSGLVNGWSTVLGTLERRVDQDGTYLHCTALSSGLGAQLSTPFTGIKPGGQVAFASDFRGPVTTGPAFIDVEWHNGGDGTFISWSSGATNPVYMGSACAGWTRFGGALGAAPATTDGSATLSAIIRVLAFTAGQEFRDLMLEPGTVNSRYADNATAVSATNIDQTGRLVSADGLPLNTQAGKAAAISPQYPLSAPAVGQIAVAATTVTLTARTYSLPAATLTGLANDTTYAVFYDLQTSSYVAVSSGAAAYQASAARYISLGDPQRTQPAGGGTPASPPSAPPGGGGGFGGGWATP